MAVSATAAKKDTQFIWEGKDKRGNKVRGKAIAANEAALRADLRRQGVAATRVKSSSNRGGGKVSNVDIAVFSRQLATMMAAGIPMVQSFEIIGNGHEKPAMQRLVLDIKANVEGGSTLKESLAKHPLYFDDLFVNLVEAGEQAGALETLLDKIAGYKEKTEALKKKIKKALFYPAAVLVVAVVVSLILAVPAAYAFARFKFRGGEDIADQQPSLILSGVKAQGQSQIGQRDLRLPVCKHLAGRCDQSLGSPLPHGLNGRRLRPRRGAGAGAEYGFIVWRHAKGLIVNRHRLTPARSALKHFAEIQTGEPPRIAFRDQGAEGGFRFIEASRPLKQFSLIQVGGRAMEASASPAAAAAHGASRAAPSSWPGSAAGVIRMARALLLSPLASASTPRTKAPSRRSAGGDPGSSGARDAALETSPARSAAVNARTLRTLVSPPPTTLAARSKNPAAASPCPRFTASCPARNKP